MSTVRSEKLRFGKITALLCTILFMSYYYYGLRAFLTAGVSVGASVLTEYLCCTARRIKYDWGDVSPIMSGLLLALIMPASVPYTVIAFASAFMASVCKQAFGGNKNLIFCPVCVAYIFTTFCFPSAVVRYPTPVPFGSVDLANNVADTLSHSYTYALDNGTASAFSLLDLIWGKLAGPMGTSAVLIILICGVALYFFGDIPSAALFSGFGVNVLINVLRPVGETGWYAVLNSLVAGSYLFVLIFMACDLRFVPNRVFSQICYGAVFAVGSYLIRLYTGIENGAIFVLPMLNVFRDEFDRLTDQLERLLRFIFKYLKIFSAKAWAFAKKYTVKAAKLAAGGFDKMCDRIADRIAERRPRKEPEKKKAKDEPKLEISEIVGIVSDGAAEETPEEAPEETTEKTPEEAPEEDPEENEEENADSGEIKDGEENDE